MLKRVLEDKGGEGYIDVAVMVLSVFLVLALSMKLLPVFIAKQQLDTYATELCREAEISGRETIVFEGVKNAEGRLCNIRCSNVLLRLLGHRV